MEGSFYTAPLSTKVNLHIIYHEHFVSEVFVYLFVFYNALQTVVINEIYIFV